MLRYRGRNLNIVVMSGISEMGRMIEPWVIKILATNQLNLSATRIVLFFYYRIAEFARVIVRTLFRSLYSRL